MNQNKVKGLETGHHREKRKRENRSTPDKNSNDKQFCVYKGLIRFLTDNKTNGRNSEKKIKCGVFKKLILIYIINVYKT